VKPTLPARATAALGSGMGALALATALAGCIAPGSAPPGSAPPATAPAPPAPPPAPATVPAPDAATSPTPSPPADPTAARRLRPARLVAAAGDGAGGSADGGVGADRPALAIGGSGASPRCLAAIEEFAERHSGNRVMLGQAAFASSDELVLNRTPHRGPDGRPLDGRAPPPTPLVLRLATGPAGCMVRVVEGAAPGAAGGAPPEIVLPDCRCRPLQE